MEDTNLRTPVAKCIRLFNVLMAFSSRDLDRDRRAVERGCGSNILERFYSLSCKFVTPERRGDIEVGCPKAALRRIGDISVFEVHGHMADGNERFDSATRIYHLSSV